MENIDFAALWDVARVWLGGGLCMLGAFLTITGSVGMLRFPDFYTRMHAASVTDTAAATALLLGMALLPGAGVLVLIKLASIWIFIMLTAPTGSHAIANAALTANLQPVVGEAAQKQQLDENGAD